MTPKAADAASKLEFAEKWFLKKAKKDADAKLNYVNGGTQEWKFNFVKIFFSILILVVEKWNYSIFIIITLITWYTFSFIYITSFIIEYR